MWGSGFGPLGFGLLVPWGASVGFPWGPAPLKRPIRVTQKGYRELGSKILGCRAHPLDFKGSLHLHRCTAVCRFGCPSCIYDCSIFGMGKPENMV